MPLPPKSSCKTLTGEHPGNSLALHRVFPASQPGNPRILTLLGVRTHFADVNDWPLLTTPPELSQDEVHVWRIPLSTPRAVIDQRIRDLSETERRDLSRYRSEEVHQKGLVGAMVRRTLLARYLKKDGCALLFTKGPCGKPALQNPCDGETLQFNMSYSGDWLLLAVARSRRLGVDIERWTDVNFDDVISAHFSASEIDEWRALPESLRKEGFFNAWTRKEAYVKALGMGLSLPLQSFRVRFDPRAPAALLACDRAPDASTTWSMFGLRVQENYSGALVVEGPAPKLLQAEFRLCLG
jgi:4'-phosphopantetheinyl transferase